MQYFCAHFGYCLLGHNFSLFWSPTYINMDNSYPKRGQNRHFWLPRHFLSMQSLNDATPNIFTFIPSTNGQVFKFYRIEWIEYMDRVNILSFNYHIHRMHGQDLYFFFYAIHRMSHMSDSAYLKLQYKLSIWHMDRANIFTFILSIEYMDRTYTSSYIPSTQCMERPNTFYAHTLDQNHFSVAA